MNLLSINIGIDPNIVTLGGLTVSWLGVFIVIAIGSASALALRYGASERVGIDEDSALNLVFIIVASGIVGARVLYVAERYGDSSSLDSFVDLFKLNEGGISIYGSLIGGAIGGWTYGLLKGLPCAATADAAALGMLLGIAIGRIGDVINGEHISKASQLPWAVNYTHPDSPSFELGPMHPVVGYEAIGALLILGLLMFLWQRQPKSGVIFASAFLLYAVMRFFISFLRLDSKEPALGLSTPQLVSVVVIAIAVPALLHFMRRSPADPAGQS